MSSTPIQPADHRCRYCGKNHLEGSPLEIQDWAWRSIITLERRWLEKHYRRPRCLICDGPLVCGQSATHYTCEELASAACRP